MDNAGHEYSFYYTNTIVYIILLASWAALWLGAAMSAEYALAGLLKSMPRYVMPLVDVIGLVAGVAVLKTRLAHLYVFDGSGRLCEGHVEIRLKHSGFNIEYSAVKRLVYRDAKSYNGLIISARGRSAYIEEPVSLPAGCMPGQSLLGFYQALDAAVASSRDQPTAGENQSQPI